MATILITGGSGLIGTALTAALLRDGHTVRHLGRGRSRPGTVRQFTWDIHRGTMDDAALDGVDHIIHLAGAGIADKRWTDTRVKELIDSRSESARLLLRMAQREGLRPTSFISAAGINYYGAVTTGHTYVESDPAGTDTIARISVAWEAAVDEWSSLCRVVKLRTPIVLSPTGGALAKLALPVRWGLGAPLGTGRQWMPWVHLEDLVDAYRHALTTTTLQGPYNVCAAEQVDNRSFTRALGRVLGRPVFLPAVPAFALRLALGELSSILLEGSAASSERLRSTGFTFRHERLEDALRELLG
ncbi:MAG: TIGR01777 family oxidoreductase [Flavobacteriales bacterium]